jgi:uncharacterized membrane protein YbhN (UPF0104 family)
MVSRERLVNTAESVARVATARRTRAAGQLLLLVTFVFVLVRVRSIWHDSSIDLAGVDWWALIGALLIAAGGVAASAFIWLVILERLGLRTRPRWVSIFFQAQLAKYIPGSVWQYAGRAALARRWGLPMRPVAISIPVELGASIAAGVIVSALLLGWWGILIVAAALLICVLAARRVERTGTRWRRELAVAGSVVPLYAAAWVVIGASFWLTADALLSVPASEFPFYVGAFVASWIVGLIAIYAPGGIGVRESVMVALLYSRIGSGNALAVAAVSRAMLTLIDVGFAGVAFLFLRRGDQSSLGPEATRTPVPSEPREPVAP